MTRAATARFQGHRAADDAEPGGVPTATILSDLSANIFAALLIVLILLLQIRVDAVRRPPDARPVDIERALPRRPHRPLDGAQAVAMLKDRGADASGLSLDVTDDGVRLPDGTLVRPGAALDAALSRATTAEPVRLYVFSNRFFAAVTGSLTRSGLGWSDLSVPRALRASDNPQRWSPAFLDLLALRRSERDFRSGLARLLAAAPGPLVTDGHVSGGGGAPPPPGPSASVSSGTTLAALAHILSVALAVSALAAGVALVAVVESGVGRSRRIGTGASIPGRRS